MQRAAIDAHASTTKQAEDARLDAATSEARPLSVPLVGCTRNERT